MNFSDRVEGETLTFEGQSMGPKGVRMPEVIRPITPKNKTYLVEYYEATPGAIEADARGLTVLEAGTGCQYAVDQNIVALPGDLIEIAEMLFVHEDDVIGLLNLNELP